MKKVYISGPIKGIADGNREAFSRRATEIEADGHSGINPHMIDHSHEGPCIGPKVDSPALLEPHNYGCYLAADIRVLLECDAIDMLPGWAGSLGAQTELAVAKAVGIPMYVREYRTTDLRVETG